MAAAAAEPAESRATASPDCRPRDRPPFVPSTPAAQRRIAGLLAAGPPTFRSIDPDRTTPHRRTAGREAAPPFVVIDPDRTIGG
jgi:hypothetical protein